MVWHVKGLLWFGMIHLSAEGGTDRFGFGISGFGFRVSDFGVGVSGSKYTLVRVQPSPFGLIPRRQPEGDSRLRALIRFSSKGGGGVQSAARPESLRGWATRNLGIAVCPHTGSTNRPRLEEESSIFTEIYFWGGDLRTAPRSEAQAAERKSTFESQWCLKVCIVSESLSKSPFGQSAN